MRLLIGLVLGALIAAAVGAAAIAYSVKDGGAWVASAGAADGAQTHALDLKDFNSLRIKGVFNLTAEVGPDYAVELTGRPEELERAVARVEEGALILERRNVGNGALRRGSAGVTARVTMPALTAIDVSGVVDGEVTGIAADALAVDLSGVGDLTLKGTCKSFDAHVSGVGDLNAEELKCETVKIVVSGVGDAIVYASAAVDAKVSGVGQIEVKGSPEQVMKAGGPFSRVKID